MKNSREDILIKEATLKDASEITSVHKQCVLKTNAQFYAKNVIGEWVDQINDENVKEQFKNSQWLVIKTKDKIVGFCQFSLEEKTLYQINILPDHQGRNYGKLMYDFIERKFLDNGIRKIYLNSTLNAVNFYKKMGFKEIEKIDFKLEKKSIEMVKMEKTLK